MLEQLINSLDSRGILVMQAMLGKRSIELLEDMPGKKEKKSSLLLPGPISNDLMPATRDTGSPYPTKEK